jgi:hypothetical protein
MTMRSTDSSAGDLLRHAVTLAYRGDKALCGAPDEDGAGEVQGVVD